MVGFAAAQTNPTLVNPDSVPAQIVPTYGEVGITWGGFAGGSGAMGGRGRNPSFEHGGHEPRQLPAWQLKRRRCHARHRLRRHRGDRRAAAGRQRGARRGRRASRERVPQRAHQQRLQQRHRPLEVHDLGLPGSLQQIWPGLHGRGHREPAGPGHGSQLLDARQCECCFPNDRQPATTLQAYGGWVFGSSAGARIAAVSDDNPLSQLVSAQSLSNNGMSSWTVGQFRQVMTNRLGLAVNQAVLTPS